MGATGAGVHMVQNAATKALMTIPATGHMIGRQLNKTFRAGAGHNSGPASETVSNLISPILPDFSLLHGEARHGGHFAANSAIKHAKEKFGEGVAAKRVIDRIQAPGTGVLSIDELRSPIQRNLHHAYLAAKREDAHPVLKRFAPAIGLLSDPKHHESAMAHLMASRREYPGLANIAEGFAAESELSRYAPKQKPHNKLLSEVSKTAPVVASAAFEPVSAFVSGIKHLVGSKSPNLTQFSKGVQRKLSNNMVVNPVQKNLALGESGVPHRVDLKQRLKNFGFDMTFNPITGEGHRASRVMGELNARGTAAGY